MFYAFTVILFSESLLGLVVSRPQAAVPLVMDSFLGSLILWFYVNNSTQSGDDLEPEIRSKLPTSVSALPIKISRVHWITNAPRLFLFGVIWIACSIASILIFDWRCIVMLCMSGVLSLMTHWMFSRLNYVTLKEDGIIIAHWFPADTDTEWSYGSDLSVEVTQNWMERAFEVHTVSISDDGSAPVGITLTDGHEIALLMRDAADRREEEDH